VFGDLWIDYFAPARFESSESTFLINAPRLFQNLLRLSPHVTMTRSTKGKSGATERPCPSDRANERLTD
jgi:hypothetical protein